MGNSKSVYSVMKERPELAHFAQFVDLSPTIRNELKRKVNGRVITLMIPNKHIVMRDGINVNDIENYLKRYVIVSNRPFFSCYQKYEVRPDATFNIGITVVTLDGMRQFTDYHISKLDGSFDIICGNGIIHVIDNVVV